MTQIDRNAMEDQERLLYSYGEGKIKILPTELPLVRRSPVCTKVHDVQRPNDRQRCQKLFARHGISMKYARLV